MKKFNFVTLFVLFSAAFLVGCGSGNVPLKGTVVFSDDGAPLESGTIAFTDGSMQARGDIKAGGEFQMGTLKDADGLKPGTYTVYISGAVKREEASRSGDGPTAVVTYRETRLIDPKYDNASTSGLSYTIDANTKTLEIKVDRATGKDAEPQLR